MTAAPRPAVADRPAAEAYAAHVLRCWYAEHGIWCSECLGLDWEANAESHRRVRELAARRATART